MKQCYECEGAYAFFPAQMLTVLPFGWLFYLQGTLTVETFVTVIILSLGMSAPTLWRPSTSWIPWPRWTRS